MSFPSRIILSTPPKIVGKKEKLVQNALLAQRAPIPTMPVVPSFIQEAYNRDKEDNVRNLVLVKSIGIKKVSKRQPTPKKNGGPTPLLSREDQVVVMLLTELAKRYSQDDQPISRLDSAAILRKVFEELLKRPIEKEYAEIEYYAMMSWRKIPPPSSLMRAMGAPKLAMESDMECMVRHLQDRLHDVQVRNAAHSLLRKLAV